MKVSILNNFRGDGEKDIDTSTAEGRAKASKLVTELLHTGSAIFLEREVDGETKTYRVTGYDPATDKLVIKIDFPEDAAKDPAIEVKKLKKKTGRIGPRGHYGRVSSSAGRSVSVAPVSGGY